jgi:hypothetical protein
MSVRVLGDERALALAGLPDDPPDGAHTVHLGHTTGPADVVWLAAPPAEPLEGRVIAPSGDDLWSRAPWPARDELFELPPPPEPCALVVGDDAERRTEVVGKLEALGRPVAGAAALTVEDLARASVVALLGDAGAGTDGAPWRATTVPAEAPAVLAARRLLIAPRADTTFGLLPGTDHLAFATVEEVVQYADAALTFPASFEPFPVLGAVAAAPHRASLVYARLAADLAG